MTGRLPLAAVCVLLWLSSAASAQTLGILGDSSSDEFRADDNRGGAYAATTRNWVELLAVYRGVTPGPWGTRSAPRRTGYAYNWARSGARACDVITGGQAAGLQSQIAAGQVQWAVLFAGANDFAPWNGTYQAIYSGALSGAALEASNAAIVDCLTQAMDAMAGVGPGRAYVGTVMDNGPWPAFQAAFPDAAGRQRVTDAIGAVNASVASAAMARGVTVMDLTAYGQYLLAQADANGNIVVGGELITMMAVGDEPHHLALADGLHMGTVANALVANFFLSHLNTAGFGAAPFSDPEMLVMSGITPTPPAEDTTPPTVSVTAPASGASIAVGTSVAITATASDNEAVAGVRFLIDGADLIDDTAAPYTATWIATQGAHTIRAEARDTNGNVTLSAPVTVTGITPPPSPITTTPSAVSVITGSWVSGTLASLAGNENDYYVVRSLTIGTIRNQDTDLTIPVSGSPVSLSLAIRMRGNLSTMGLAIRVLRVSDGAWIDCLYQPSGLGPTEAVKSCAGLSPGTYLSAGVVRVRVSTGQWNVTNQTSVDQVTLTASY